MRAPVSGNVATAPAAGSATRAEYASDLRKHLWGGRDSNPRPRIMSTEPAQPYASRRFMCDASSLLGRIRRCSHR
jgi:hypothetical protein